MANARLSNFVNHCFVYKCPRNQLSTLVSFTSCNQQPINTIKNPTLPPHFLLPSKSSDRHKPSAIWVPILLLSNTLLFFAPKMSQQVNNTMVPENAAATASGMETYTQSPMWWLEEDINPRIRWCFENQDAILALHSSPVETNILAM